MLKYLTLALIIGLSYGVPSVAQSGKHIGDGSKGNQGAETDKRGTETSPLVVNEHSIQSKEEAAEESARDAKQDSTNAWIIGLTFAIAICAGLQFFGILGQIFVYLALKVRIFVENLGGSRAFSVRAWGMVDIVYEATGGPYDTGYLQRFPSIIEADKKSHPLNVGGLGRQIEGMGDFMAITDDIFQMIRKGEAFIKVSGALVYEDIFEDTNETPFFLVWNTRGNNTSGQWPDESYWLDKSPKPSPPKNVKKHNQTN